MSASIIVLLVAAFVLGAFAAIYNSLIRKKNLMQEGWSGVDVQLKRRANLIPNLVETVKGYAEHEKGVFETVTQLRAEIAKASSPEERSRAENQMTSALGQLFAIVENYPALKADKNFQELQSALTETEDQIQYARRYYNAAVRDFNIDVQSFPNNIIASLCHFTSEKFFELENSADRSVPHVAIS